METKSISSTEAQNNLGLVMNDAVQNGTRYVVARHGLPQVAVIGVKDLLGLLANPEEQKGFIQLLETEIPSYSLGKAMESGKVSETRTAYRVDDQLKLNMEVVGNAKANGSSFHDPSFMKNKSSPVHRWVPWIAGFSREFVSDVLDRYQVERGLVVDPFSGVGTTLVEAMIKGHDAIGFEINPYAAFSCEVKTKAAGIDSQQLAGEVSRFQERYLERAHSKHEPQSKAPEGFKTRQSFYSPKVLRKVLIVQDLIENIDDQDIQNLFRLAFGASLVTYSNYSYEPSLGTRESVGKPLVEDYGVGEMLHAKLCEMSEDIDWLRYKMATARPNVQVIKQSFFKAAGLVGEGCADLIITSPPYFNNYHYIRNTRPHMYWLGYASRPKDLEPLEQDNFGKYWQTVRDSERVPMDFELPDSDLHEKLDQLAHLNTQKQYGGLGWANYAASYFNDCHRFAVAAKGILKPGGRAIVVIGNSILQGMTIETDRYLSKIAEGVGLETVRIEIPRQTRTGNSIVQSDVRVGRAKDESQLYEAIVELRKP